MSGFYRYCVMTFAVKVTKLRSVCLEEQKEPKPQRELNAIFLNLLTPLNKQNSLLCVSVDQGVVGEHEPSVRAEQQSVAHIRHWRGFCRPPGKHTQMDKVHTWLATIPQNIKLRP